MNFYIGDPHFGHKDIINFDNRPFASVEEMDQELIRRWNRRVRDGDDVYIIGDFCYKAEHKPSWYLEQLNGRKHLIIGNHDRETLNDPDAIKMLASVDKMMPVKDGDQNIVLCHFPIAEWRGYYHGVWHIYAHVHGELNNAARFMLTQERALNAGCMLNDYQPSVFDELAFINMNRQIELMGGGH